MFVYGGFYGGYMVFVLMIDYGDCFVGGVNIVGIFDFKIFLLNIKGYWWDLCWVEYGDECDLEIVVFFEEISLFRNVVKINKLIFII